ncbi:MAG TPA: hypothetical protein VFH78_03555 [Candidatus Thermoplasmatota archaeon]|nr:hypothetical protein [Candidatus Thermoplasmatota archaeon]
MDRRELCFILSLIGGVLSIASALMMGLMMMAMFGFSVGMIGGGGAAPLGFMALFFAWMLMFGLVGGVLMLVGAPRVRRPAEARSGAMWVLVGGIVSAVGGNLLAGALGIVGGALLMSETHPVVA